jgi:hypothetical protein
VAKDPPLALYAWQLWIQVGGSVSGASCGIKRPETKKMYHFEVTVTALSKCAFPIEARL